MTFITFMYCTCLHSSTKACTLKYVNKIFQHHVPSTKYFLTTSKVIPIKIHNIPSESTIKTHRQLFRMTCCKYGKVTIPIYKISLDKCIHYQWRSNPKHFDILAISWQFKKFRANNWQCINNLHRPIKLRFEKKNNVIWFSPPSKTIHWL